MADESTGGDLISSALTGVLAEAGKLPIRTDAREMQRAECDRLVREIGAKIEAIGPFAIPITFANMQAEGYMLSEPAQVAIDDPRDSKRRTLETFYIFVTSLGIYAARIFENQKRSGLMGKGDWKTHFRDHDYEYSSDRNLSLIHILFKKVNS